MSVMLQHPICLLVGTITGVVSYFLLNGNKFMGNRKNSDNWFEYYTDGEWHYLVLNLRKDKNIDVNAGAALTTVEYVIFDYAGNNSGKKTADEYIDIAYIAFY